MATVDQLNALSQDGYFRQRVKNLVLQEAGAILAESAATPNHNARCSFAITLFNNPAKAETLTEYICARTNLVASVVTYDFAKRGVVTDASDAAIRSQINTDWNVLAGTIP